MHNGTAKIQQPHQLILNFKEESSCSNVTKCKTKRFQEGGTFVFERRKLNIALRLYKELYGYEEIVIVRFDY